MRGGAKLVLLAGFCLGACGNKGAPATSDDAAAKAVSDAAPVPAPDAAAKAKAPPTQPRALPAPAALTPEQIKALRGRLVGRWVSDTGLESITWTIDGAGAVREVVHRRGQKGKPLRSRRFTISLERAGEFIAHTPTEQRRYSFMLRKRRLYASDRYGVFPRPSAKRFAVEADGIAIRFADGACSGVRAGGAPIDVRCKYVKSGPLEVFTARYQLPGRPRPTMTVFHKAGPYLVHETMLSCCEFKRR